MKIKKFILGLVLSFAFIFGVFFVFINNSKVYSSTNAKSSIDNSVLEKSLDENTVLLSESNEQTRPEDGVWHDQYVDRSAIQVGDVFYAETNMIHIFNDMHTTVQVGTGDQAYEEVVDWKISLKEDGVFTESLEIKWDEELVVPFGKVYTYHGTYFEVTDVPGTWFLSGTCIARLNNGVLTVGSKTGYDASMDDHVAGNRAEWCIQPFNSYITKVVVLDKVTWIGDYAFYNLPNLKEVEIASSVAVIGNYAFSGSGLETIVIPDTVTSLYSHIFDGCSLLSNVKLPKGANVGDYMFANCGSLTDLSIFDGVNSFGAGAFSGCSGLVDVTIPDSVTSIGNGVFGGCGNLKRLKFSDNIKIIPDYTCSGCGNLEEVIIGSGTTVLYNYAFGGCYKLEKAFFNRPSEPNGNVTFVYFPFEACTSLYYTGEPENMTLFWFEYIQEEGKNIHNDMCTQYVDGQMTYIWLDKNAIATDYSGDCKVVRDWKGLATISVRDDGGEGNDGSGRMADGYNNWYIDAHNVTTRLPISEVVIEDGVTHIGAGSFTDNEIEHVTFGADVESIGDNAFSFNPIIELNFPLKLKSIGAQAFYYDYYLNKVTFLDSVTHIGDEAFRECKQLKTIVLPKYLEVLGGSAFVDCSSLTCDITIPKTVTSVGAGAFGGTKVTDVYLEMQPGDMNPNYGGLNNMTVHMYGTSDAKLYRVADGVEIVDGSNMGNTWKGFIWRVPADFESGDCIVHIDGMYVTVTKNPNSNGNGEMADYATVEDRPWHDRIRDIIAIDFEDGVTKIGNRTFKGLGDEKLFDVKYINLPNIGLKTVGDEAFKGYLGSINMKFSSSLTYIGNNAIGDRYFGNAIFVCPDERSTLTLGENAFVGGSFGFEKTGSMILYDDEYRIPDTWEALNNHSGRTLIWRDELFRVVINSTKIFTDHSGYTETYQGYSVNVNGRFTQNAGVNDFVTVIFTTDEDETVTKFNVYQRKIIHSVQDLAEVLGNTEIVGNDDIVLKAIDNRVVFVQNGEIVFELTDDYSVSKSDINDVLTDYDFTCDGKPRLTFGFSHNLLSNVSVYSDEFFFECIRIENKVKVLLKNKDIEYTKVDKNTYTFTMPDDWVTVEATIATIGIPTLPAIKQMAENCELIISSGENSWITEANPGDIITINIQTDPTFVFKRIFAYVSSSSVTSINQLVNIMGKAIFEGIYEHDLQTDFTGLNCKINENGHFMVMNGNEIVAELVNGTIAVNDIGGGILFVNLTDEENIWLFRFNNGMLTLIGVQNKETNGYIFVGSGECEGVLGEEIELIEIEKGKKYTFVMPETGVNVFASYLMTYSINIEDTENGNVITSNDGNPVNNSKANDTITITIEHEQGYELKELSVLMRNDSIKSIEQVEALMGDAIFTSGNTICKIGESGNFVLVQDGSVIAELSAITNIYIENPLPNYCMVHITTSEYGWHFGIDDGVLNYIYVTNGFETYGQGNGIFEPTYEEITLKEIIKGQKYTFVMPDGVVEIVATFEEHAIPEHEHNANTLEFVQAKDATCEENGNIAYYHCTVCGKNFSDANGENEITLESTVIPALTHNYQFVEFVWDGFTAQAKYVCVNDNEHVVFYNAVVTNEITTEAKCETTGIRTYTATYDGHTGTKEETITAIGHAYNIFDSFVWTDFTAKAKYICSHDSTHFELHDAVVTSEITTAAKCETTGVRTYTATYEGHTDTKEETIDALGHDWNEWVIEKEATETEEGLKTRTCKNDPTHVETMVIPVTTHEHNLEYIEEVPATCTKDGMKGYYKCSECDLMFEDEEATIEIADLSTLVIKASHTPANAVRENEVAATCENNGSYDEVVYCSVCGEELSRETKTIPALGHDYQFDSFIWDGFTAKAKYICSHDESHYELHDAVVTNEITKEAKCETTGIRTYTATYEGHTDTKEETIESLGHEWSNWVVTKEAQIGVKGEETRTCSRCGKTEKRDIKALPYIPVTNNTGEKVYNEIITEEPKDVTELFAQAKAEAGSVEVKTDELTISFNNDAVNAIGDANVKISAKVSTENLKVENAQMVLDVTLTGATFEKGKAIVNIPFNKEVPAGKVAKVYYIAVDGTRTDMNATFENGKVTFVTNHFSTYAIIFEDVVTTGIPGWGIALIIIGAIILTCGICYLLLFFVFNKWAEIDGKKVRIFKLGKKEKQVRIITMKCMIKYIDEAQILNSKE